MFLARAGLEPGPAANLFQVPRRSSEVNDPLSCAHFWGGVRARLLAPTTLHLGLRESQTVHASRVDDDGVRAGEVAVRPLLSRTSESSELEVAFGSGG